MRAPAVSVALPVRNSAATLPRALASLAAQTLGDFEVVAVNDGSADETPATLDAWARRDARIRIIHTPPLGLVHALNRCLEEAQAPLVARMDADDVCLPDRLAAQQALFEADTRLGLVSCLARFGGERHSAAGYAAHVDWCNSVLDPHAIPLRLFQESCLPHPTVMLRRDFALRYGGYRSGPFPEDYEFWLRLAAHDIPMAKVPEYLLEWNDPPTRLSRTDPRYAVEAFYTVKAQWLARWLARHNPCHPVITCLGAGRVSRKRAALLEAEGVVIDRYVDVDPRKVGKTVHGRPVIHREALEPPGRCFAVSFVASRGAAADIEAFLSARGWRFGRDFLLAA